MSGLTPAHQLAALPAPGDHAWSGMASACSRPPASSPRCSISISCSKNSPARSSRTSIPFVFTNSADLDPAIVAEFAHTVYRFGHSMLTDTVDRLDNDLTLVDGDHRADRPDRGLPQSGRVQHQRQWQRRHLTAADITALASMQQRRRRHFARHDAAGRQRDRRVRRQRLAQQPCWPAARSRSHQHRAWPRYRHSVPQSMRGRNSMP